MTINFRKRINCNNISYRKGYIEVVADVHEGLINMESWNIHSEVNITERMLGEYDFPIDGVVGNTELELSVNEAKLLIKRLEFAIKQVTDQI